MVLVDTSVWVDHLREGNSELVKLLDNGQVMCHPFIVGEIACGNLKNRKMILGLLRLLPQVVIAQHDEIMEFIEINHLMGKGLGYVDIHIAAAALLNGIKMWTNDKSLIETAEMLGIRYKV
jgi:predicted nucleic acid-binding protein